MKLKFDDIGNACFDPNGEHDIPAGLENTVMTQRFYLEDGVVKDRYPNLTDEQIASHEESSANQKRTEELNSAKQVKIFEIKSEARKRIEATDWKKERATERNDNTELSNVLAEREAIRTASDSAESQVLSFTTLEQVTAFDHTSW